MYIDADKVSYFLGSLNSQYQNQLFLLIEQMLQLSKKGIGAFHVSPSYESFKSFSAKDPVKQKQATNFTSQLELLLKNAKHGNETLKDDYVIAIGPAEMGGVYVELKINRNGKGGPTPPWVQIAIENENKKPFKVNLPLLILMRKFKLDPEKYTGYNHGVCMREGGDPLVYAGITRRHWLTRYQEHFNEAKSGSKKTFHRHWIAALGDASALSFSQVVAVNMSFNDAMNWEECYVDLLMARGLSLNMIPGGRKGLQFLHEHRLLNFKDRPGLDEIESAKEKLPLSARSTTNPLISAMWNNPDYAAKVICGHKERLSIEQISLIRAMAKTCVPLEVITSKVDARNSKQVERVISGKTYSKVLTVSL